LTCLKMKKIVFLQSLYWTACSRKSLKKLNQKNWHQKTLSKLPIIPTGDMNSLWINSFSKNSCLLLHWYTCTCFTFILHISLVPMVLPRSRKSSPPFLIPKWRAVLTLHYFFSLSLKFWATRFELLAILGSLWHIHILLFLALTYSVTP
jgi:hypothetical protein